jgi:hypothetical protein
VAITAGAIFTCAILDDGQLRCWGSSGYGQLAQGNNDTIGDNPGESTVPVNLGAGRTAVAVSADESHACAILDNGQLRCWGKNATGQLGLGSMQNVGDGVGETPAPVNLGLGRRAIAVSAGSDHTCAILDTGQLRCWGGNSYGQLGQGNTGAIGDNPGESTVPVDLGPGRTAIAVSAGYGHTCAALDDRTVRCWGKDTGGQLGQGGTQPWGASPGETPGALAPILLGGQLFGRDADGDGLRDAVDACPSAAAGTADGCPVAAPSPPGATVRGTKVVVDTVLVKTKAAAKCPKTAKVVVKTKTANGKVTVTKALKSKAAVGGCRVKGKVKLPAKPAKKAKVKLTITGKKLKTKHLVAVRP